MIFLLPEKPLECQLAKEVEEPNQKRHYPARNKSDHLVPKHAHPLDCVGWHAKDGFVAEFEQDILQRSRAISWVKQISWY